MTGSAPEETDAVAAAPVWFREAVEAPRESGRLTVEGAEIVWEALGRSGPQDLLLLHGGAAHRGWWDHIAPQLATGRRVAAFDLSGHGDSDHRESYSLETWAAEARAVAEAAGLATPFVVLGHSLGGIIALHAARSGAVPASGALIVDSPMSSETPRPPASRERIPVRRPHAYPSYEETLAHFRPVPAQRMLPYIADRIARASIRAVEGGWTWKFDPALFGSGEPFASSLDGLPCPVVLFAAEHGLLAEEFRHARTTGGQAIVPLPGAGHAPVLDEPELLITAVRSVLAGWATTNR